MIKREVVVPIKKWPLVALTVFAIAFCLGVYDCSERIYPEPRAVDAPVRP